MDLNNSRSQNLVAYLDGINQFQASPPGAPLEFEVLYILKRPSRYKTILPVSATWFTASRQYYGPSPPTYVFFRDKLGPDYLRIFDLDWRLGVVGRGSGCLRRARPTTSAFQDKDWRAAASWLHWKPRAPQSPVCLCLKAAMPGSFRQTPAGKPAGGRPALPYSAPSVWYERT